MHPPRVFITGASGLLGGNLMHLLPPDWMVVGVGNTFELKTTPSREYIRADFLGSKSSESIVSIIERVVPDIIIHAAAMTNVDRCEGVDRELARRLHVDVTREIAQIAKEKGAYLVHISTDHLFDGVHGNYTEDDVSTPVNYYAETKWLGERVVIESGVKHVIIRTNFFGFNIQEKNDFAGWILSSLVRKEPIRLFTDVIFSPILVNTLVERMIKTVEARPTGVYHIAAHNACSKYDFGVLLAEIFGLSKDLIVPTSIDDIPNLVRRPKNMSLNVSQSEKKLGAKFPTVAESIALFKQLYDTGYQRKLRQTLNPKP